MHVHVDVCVSVYGYICLCTCIRIRASVCIRTYEAAISIDISMCVYIYMYVGLHRFTRASVKRIHIRTCVHTWGVAKIAVPKIGGNSERNPHQNLTHNTGTRVLTIGGLSPHTSYLLSFNSLQISNKD